jgi:hypothetical protein
MTKRNFSRRKFLKTGALAAGAATVGTVAMPQVSRAQSTTIKMQGSWGAKDVFNEMAQDYVERVNKMAGGRMKIDYLPDAADAVRVRGIARDVVQDRALVVLRFEVGHRSGLVIGACGARATTEHKTPLRPCRCTQRKTRCPQRNRDGLIRHATPIFSRR